MRFADVFPNARFNAPAWSEYECSHYNFAAVHAAIEQRIAGGFVLHRDPTREGVALVVRLPERRLAAFALAPDGKEYAAKVDVEGETWCPTIARRWAHDAIASR